MDMEPAQQEKQLCEAILCKGLSICGFGHLQGPKANPQQKPRGNSVCSTAIHLHIWVLKFY